MRQRSVSFDVLKGIAVLLVILGHVFRTSLRGAPSVIEDVIYSIHMPLFVLVTGYFATRPIHWTIKGVFSFWRTKVLRLLLPLLFIAEIAQIADEGAISLPLRSMVGGVLVYLRLVYDLCGVLPCARLESSYCEMLYFLFQGERAINTRRIASYCVVAFYSCN